MIRKQARSVARVKRHLRIRNHLSGTPQRPRLAVFRSNKHIYAQIIDDAARKTLCAASTAEKAIAEPLSGKTWNTAAATAVGKALAERAKEKGVSAVVFDRGGYVFHGKVKALADAAREAGLNF
ncbi:MAG: 50S ribosomal protein L18 [Clostridiales bacterium]|jgi:large subunit ribosomal protein L18|nr:50S ribosomal protein L18 [Clostridiales bacterium]